MRYVLCLLLSFLILSACGGGGGGSNSGNETSTIKSGVFVDAPVSGLYYETATLSGKTDSDGKFSYRAGETVTFKIGNLTLGSSAGSDTVTPLSLTGETDIDNVSSKAVNIARILQTIDANNSDNVSISIPSSLDSLDVGSVDFTNEVDLQRIVEQAKTITSNNYALVDADTAENNMQNYVKAYTRYEPIDKVYYFDNGIKYYRLTLKEDTKVYFSHIAYSSTFSHKIQMYVYDLGMNLLKSPIGLTQMSKGTYILKFNDSTVGTNVVTFNYPGFKAQEYTPILKNGTYEGEGVKFYTLHMANEDSIEFTVGSSGTNSDRIILDKEWDYIDECGTSSTCLSNVKKLKQGDYVIIFNHGDVKNYTMTVHSLQLAD